MEYSDLMTLSDERVMERLQAGNADAFAVIFKRYHRLVYVTALRILHDATEAEDVTQTVFLEIYRDKARFDPERGTLKVWLLQYAYSRSVNRRNYLIVRHTHNHVDVAEIDKMEAVWSSRAVQGRDISHLVAQILKSLPDAQRSTIELFFFEGMTFNEIAAKTGESYSTIRHHYYRGISQLRSHLALDGPRESPARVDLTLSRARSW